MRRTERHNDARGLMPGRLMLTAAWVFLAAPLSAQTWTPEQESALRAVERSWVDDLAEDASWVDRMSHPELLSWGNTSPIPRGRADSRRWNEYQDENSDALLHTLSPVGIAVRGDVAVVHYYATVAAEDRDGERETTITRCTDTLVREDGSWLYLAWFCHDEPRREP